MANKPQIPAVQSPIVGSVGPPQAFLPSMSIQFGPMVPPQQSQPPLPVACQQYQPLAQQLQFSLRPGQAAHGPLSLPTIPMQNVLPPQQNAQTSSSYVPGLVAPVMPLSSSYTFTPSFYGNQQINVNSGTPSQPISQTHVSNIPSGGPPPLSSGSQSIFSVTPLKQTPDQSSTTVTTTGPTVQLNGTIRTSDWIEHTSAKGRRYYYNKKTRQSSWEKPLELMTPIEKADATTDWKEFSSPDGRKYYYNNVTKQSKWVLPDELKLARAHVEQVRNTETQSETLVTSRAPDVLKAQPTVDASSPTKHRAVVSPVHVEPVASVIDPPAVVTSGLSSTSAEVASPTEVVAPLPVSLVDTPTEVSTQNIEGKANITAPEEKATDKEPYMYTSKMEAKNAFKELLESANVESDWTWEQTMRVIINDKKYGALRTLGERKQTFNEFLGQRKKQEAEERRAKQKKAREDFLKMLEDCKELTSLTRWSKALDLFEDDERFKAVERAKDREDLFDDYLVELEKKEWALAAEEHKKNLVEYRKFLESCDFIKANSQWRKVQDRLESDERCSCLEKFERLEIFQEYLHDLEKEEEERIKIQKEELRKAERKNRDDFRKLMEGHVTAGTLTAKTHWRDYCMKVKDLPAYLAVSSNTSGSTPKDLFEDVAEELQKQYHEDKTRIKDAMKLGKINLLSSWSFEDFKSAISKDVNSPSVTDINLQIVFDELMERVREKEEKEAIKRKRLADDFFDLLCSTKEITASSTWEECKPHLESTQEYKSIAEENFCMEIFEEYISELNKRAKEIERKRKEERAKKERERDGREKRKLKEKKEKERGREKERRKERLEDETESENFDITEANVLRDNTTAVKDKDKKHRKRNHFALDDTSSDKNGKDRSKHPHRRGNDHKKLEQLAFSPDLESEGRHKRHKRDHQNGSRRNRYQEELEDGELD